MPFYRHSESACVPVGKGLAPVRLREHDQTEEQHSQEPDGGKPLPYWHTGRFTVSIEWHRPIYREALRGFSLVSCGCFSLLRRYGDRLLLVFALVVGGAAIVLLHRQHVSIIHTFKHRRRRPFLFGHHQVIPFLLHTLLGMQIADRRYVVRLRLAQVLTQLANTVQLLLRH